MSGPPSNPAGQVQVADVPVEHHWWRSAAMRRWLLPLWTLAMAIAVAAPWLRPGYVLNIDMVFTPHQALIPWMFGLDGGFEAVPEDAIVGALAGPLPGQVLQKVVLLATLWLAGLPGPHG